MPHPHQIFRREGLRVDQRTVTHSLALEPLEARRLLAVFNVNDVAGLTAALEHGGQQRRAANTINLSAGTYTLERHDRRTARAGFKRLCCEQIADYRRRRSGKDHHRRRGDNPCF